MFKTYEYNIDLVSEPFANLKYRDRTVLILFRNSQAQFLFEKASNYYPKGIARLLGGGVNPEETTIDAAIREIKEETGMSINPAELIELVQVNVEGTYKFKTHKTKIFVYFLKATQDAFKEGYDTKASDIVAYSEDEYTEQVKRFLELKSENLCNEQGNIFSWGDYGKVYGFVHQVALDEFLKRKI